MSESKILAAIQVAEEKARGLIADIIPLLGQIKDEAMDEVNAYLEKAIAAARRDVEEETATRLRTRPSGRGA